eukprot:CAMPEP_0195085476 /NCGR_PEP_ID=MMETSP0448-20130528/25884_1 /TAXON_ID=66468 /ORGANISM="Heterocapsa triquestra, Strain CCMP 448" /LENGTH=251 /DNA_ID=CAMNT_0040118875 /DNA_START=1 /DNA_END=753 /DNA_ORIENTATION=+
MPPMGSAHFGPGGPPPMSYPPGSMASMAMGPPGSMMGPPGTMALPGSMAWGPPGSTAAMAGPPPGPPSVPYHVVQQQLAARLEQTLGKRHELIQDLDRLTDGDYTEHVKNTFSVARQAQVDAVDWRVARLLYCKDPKFNHGLEPAIAFDVQARKAADGEHIEGELAAKAIAEWNEALAPVGMQAPPLEFKSKDPVAFVQACPNYNSDEDVWTRRLELRTLDEAMRGDVSKPLPRPAVHTEEYENFQEGKYV